MADKPSQPHPGYRPPSMSIDWEFYAAYLDNSDLSDDQKRDLINTLWSIVVSCVDLGFGIHPVQQACEQNDGNTPSLSSNLLSLLKDIPHNQTHIPAEDAVHFPAEKEDS